MNYVLVAAVLIGFGGAAVAALAFILYLAAILAGFWLERIFSDLLNFGVRK